MFTIKVYINNKLTKTIQNEDKTLMVDRFEKLSITSEKYTMATGKSSKIELYENNKMIKIYELEA